MPNLLEPIPRLPGQIRPGLPGYRVCTRCVMDTTHMEIDFDEQGVCNYCRGYDRHAAHHARVISNPAEILARRIDRMKQDGRGHDYDCILGLSGGVDSSYLALKCKDWGLRPLLVQFDNGWNTELANHNIQSLCEKLGFELDTYVVNWPEFRDLQLSFFRAGLANLEGPSDHGIFACIYRTAIKRRIPWLLSGVNDVTESCFPLGEKAQHVFSYGYRYSDLVHLRDVHRRHGRLPLKTFPTLGFWQKLWIEKRGLVKRFDPLNYLSYDKQAAISELQQRVGWRPYANKHFESVITRFHQSYILPRKFGMDKRKLHFSGLIWSGQLSRAVALTQLTLPACEPTMLARDREFFIKKLGLTEVEFEGIMKEPPRSYEEYRNINWLYLKYPQAVRAARRLLSRKVTVQA